MFDMRTLMVTYLVNSLVNTLVMAIFWRHNRKYFGGIVNWLFALVLQTAGFGLIALRGVVPDLFSVLLSNTLVAVSSLLILDGLKRCSSTSRVRFTTTGCSASSSWPSCT